MSPLVALWLKDLRVLHNLRRILRDQSRFKVAFVMGFAAAMMAAFFLMFVDGFNFLDQLGGSSFMITRRLFALVFFSLGIMLALSSLVTTYSTVFRSRETGYLLTCPIEIRALVTHKFVESTALSSWAFFFLIIPFTAAYAWHERLGPLFAVWTMLFSMPFVALCCGLGTILSLIAIRWWPRNRLFWWACGLAAVAALARIVVRPRPPDMDDAAFMLNRLLPGLQIASHPLAPNWWTAEGIMALTQGQVARGFLLFGVLLSNTLVIGLIVQWVGRATFYPAYQSLDGSGAQSRRGPELLGWLERALAWLPHDVRGMAMKDIRTFFRDPLQWSQALIFFGLLALYFASFRSFHYNRLSETWRNLIVFLNIFSVASVTCSLASRFVFPQLSLEGHGFWVIGLAPTTMRRVLMTKFGLALAGLATVSAGLMALATHMLQVAPALRALAIGLAVAIALGVAGLSTGLGAIFLDLKQTNPVAIISGFGGTMNLALGLGFMLTAIVPFGLTWHWYTLGRLAAPQFVLANRLALAWLVAATVAATVVPLWLGRRSLMRGEY
jgi:ABC-2 type transport system permease protein